MKKDTLFKNPKKHFSFNQEVALAFDDMLLRSIPHYLELQHLILNLSKTFALPRSNIYDLGCSTGTTLLNLAKNLGTAKNKIKLIGIGYSVPILKKAQKRLAPFKKQISLINHDLNRPLKTENASVIIMNLTAQFIRPQNRLKMIRSIHKGLVKGGAFIFVEKIKGENSATDNIWIKYYYNFKRANGYSWQEIKNKAQALKGVLIPYMLSQNLNLLKKAGFKKTDVFFKWFNFAGLLAVR